MNKQGKGFSRRQMLEMATGLSGFALSGTMGSVFAQEANDTIHIFLSEYSPTYVNRE